MIGYIVIGSVAGLAAGVMKKRYFVQVEENRSKKQLELAKEKSAELFEKHEQWKDRNVGKLDDWLKESQDLLSTLEKRTNLLDSKLKKWDKKNTSAESTCEEINNEVTKFKSGHEQFVAKIIGALEQRSGNKQTDLLKKLKSDFDSRFRIDYDNFLAKSESYIEEVAPRRSKNILTSIMNRYSEPSSVDRYPNYITIPYDKVKGRIIGKGGQNIAYFEKKARVNVVFNDSDPNVITVSCFHLLRREIALRALEKLCREKSINEAEIDQALERASYEVDKDLLKIGQQTADIIELPEEYRKEKLLKLIGRLKYRTSYGQNILYHSLEIAYFCSMLAAEIGADVEVAKFAGFFHDLGKAIDQDDDVDKSHDVLSKEILEEFQFPWEIVHAAWVHHDAEPAETVEAVLVKVADALSASRPGARAESSEDYFNRMQALETMALDTEGVEKVLTMSAGREIRAYVDTKEISDSDMPEMAKDLAGRIEENLSYPGKVRVNIIRQFWAKRKANDNKSVKN